MRTAKKPGQYEDELMKLKLTDKILGEKVEDGGIKVWTHVKWADDVLDLATKAGLATSTSYLHPVRHSLLDVIKDNITKEHANWTAFTSEVHAINIDTIQEHSERKARDKAEAAADLRSLLQANHNTERASRIHAGPNPAYFSQPTGTAHAMIPQPNTTAHSTGNYTVNTAIPAHDNTFIPQATGRKPPN